MRMKEESIKKSLKVNNIYKDIPKQERKNMTEAEIKDFQKHLYDGEVEFVYTKKDGSERPARGTMNPDILRKHGIPTPKEKAEASVKQEETKVKKTHKLPADSILYFDIDSDGFRSFKKDKLVSFEKN